MTPFGKEIRKLRIDADITLSEMAQALGKTASYISAVELGDKPLSEELAKDIISYLRGLEYFRMHRLPEDHLLRVADRSRRTLNIEGLKERDREAVVAFARRLPTLSKQERADVDKLLVTNEK